MQIFNLIFTGILLVCITVGLVGSKIIEKKNQEKRNQEIDNNMRELKANNARQHEDDDELDDFINLKEYND